MRSTTDHKVRLMRRSNGLPLLRRVAKPDSYQKALDALLGALRGPSEPPPRGESDRPSQSLQASAPGLARVAALPQTQGGSLS